MIVRSARVGDLAAIVEVESLCFPDEVVFPPGMFLFLIKNARTVVACDDSGAVVGFAIGFASGRTGIVYTLDVHPGHRRSGMGRWLMRVLEDLLVSDGATTLRLEAAADNPAARALYRGEGYEDVELIRDYYGRGKDAVRMIKELE